MTNLLVKKKIIRVDFACHSPEFNQNEEELNKNDLLITIKKIEKLKVRNWVASQKALGL